MGIRIITIIGLILFISPIHSQRLLGDEIAIQISSAIPTNATDAISENFSFQLAVTANTIKGNYWKFGTAYQRKTFDYKNQKLPYDFYNGDIGYFLQAFSNYQKSLLVYIGASGIAGYQVFNKDQSLLQDGATLKNTSGFVYGGKATLSLETYLSNSWVFFAFSEVNYLPKSGLTEWQSQFGIGTRIFIN